MYLLRHGWFIVHIISLFIRFIFTFIQVIVGVRHFDVPLRIFILVHHFVSLRKVHQKGIGWHEELPESLPKKGGIRLSARCVGSIRMYETTEYVYLLVMSYSHVENERRKVRVPGIYQFS
jgi:hypothetical protein